MITTVVFDAYGTLFDVTSAARRAAAEPGGEALGDAWPRLAADWRRKQLEYTWLRTLIGDYADFATVTADALDWVLDAHDLTDPALRTRLLGLFDTLLAFPEAPEVLSNLKASGYKLAILSNGTPAMLAQACTAAGIADRFDAVLSVESVRQYKPVHHIYALVEARLGAKPAQTLFVSANGWDIAGAAHFGLWTAWVNRDAAPVDRLPQRPAHIVPDLTHLARLLQ
ncbi:haloacid dehalogenase type II [Paragemmobacter straminiformis]|uniref:(S)-2-haloacid dehalogenase n=1 Tax=Paragemmobacter straminiformis TaxID=2045119 RepID=A0A842IDN5_9RHOB|nr:haloacid dehalogenase type II [Gemmobacter straminiformis]MBC2837008.1 haloacid dehalogenase type II [Gemmobacter straminiformis]